MDNVTLAIIVVVVIALAVVLKFGRRVMVSFKAVGVELKAEGESAPANAGGAPEKDPAPVGQNTQAVAGGARSVAVGGDANGATITTGDSSKTGT